MTADLQADPARLVALFLYSLAVRPLPADLPDAVAAQIEDAEAFQLDRAQVRKLAETAGLRSIGRTTFHALTSALAEDTTAIVSDRVLGGSRRFVRLAVPSADPYAWTDEALADLEAEDADDLTAAAVSSGFDCSTPLPAAFISPPSQGGEERKAQQAAEAKAKAQQAAQDDQDPEHAEDAEDAEDDQAEHAPDTGGACTKCGTVQPFTAFPIRSSGRLSSWCHSCHRIAKADWRRRHPDYIRPDGRLGENGENLDTHAAYALRSPDEIRAAIPARKHCRRCRKTKDSTAFNRDNHKRDGLSVSCRTCRANDRAADAARALIDPPIPR